MDKFSLEENREYWEDSNTISLIDLNFRELEKSFISKYLKENFDIADIGCGDGTSTVSLAPLVRSVLGIERSDLLKERANAKVAELNIDNISIVDGDILNLKLEQQFDAVITERVIINLPSWELQLKAINNLWEILKPGGLYLMVENTIDGHDALNSLRAAVGLKPLEIHWHNLYLDYETFKEAIKGKFEIIERKSFSLYYFLTRVYTQMFASFTGFGSNAKADDIFKTSDAAARTVYELMENRITFNDNNNVIGPIQGFALRKI